MGIAAAMSADDNTFMSLDQGEEETDENKKGILGNTTIRLFKGIYDVQNGMLRGTRSNVITYSLLPKKSVFIYFQISCLAICLIQIFCINIIDFVMTYFIIRDILIMIYLFSNLQKIK